jgi:hypothetical protein
MRAGLLFIFMLFRLFTVSAQQKNFVSEGIITLKNNKTTGFEKLYIVGEKVAFKNVATNTQTVYLLADIYQIEDDAQHVIYKNGERQKLAQVVVPEVEDTLFKPRYPEGVYQTKEDFIAKKPSSTEQVRPKGLVGIDKPLLTTIEHACYFFDMADYKFKDVFAISYKGHLYFQVQAILDNRNKTDRAQASDFANGFVRVIMGGDNYLYTEADLSNAWAQGLAYGGVGGAAGGMMARSFVNGKGVVWDIKNKEFNIFKNCKDYNAFVQPLYPEGVQECKKQQADNWQVRKAMEKIK